VRSITNRSVGLAVSGGGATSYRMVALVEMLEKEKVPIDVLGGISGGTLLGAYYCLKKREGLEQCVSNGPLFQALLLGAMVDSSLIRWKVDWDLGSAPVSDADVRLVAIATALRDRERPEAHAICGGTLGEAVQASGAAPGLFSPVDRRNGSPKPTRYTDGVASRLIPARAVVDYGADLVIAFNTVPAPRRRNPFDRWMLGRLAYDWTPLSRLVDIGVSFLFFLEQASSEVEEDAHVFIPTELQQEPFFEALLFYKAAAIVEHARKDANLRARVTDCGRRWREFCANPAVP
jgi:NTE family protein